MSEFEVKGINGLWAVVAKNGCFAPFGSVDACSFAVCTLNTDRSKVTLFSWYAPDGKAMSREEVLQSLAEPATEQHAEEGSA